MAGILLMAGYPDGSANAPAGSAQLPALLSGYTKRAPWRVSGVDYLAGYPSAQVFTDPTIDSLPSGVAVNTTTKVVTVSSNNVTLDGWDFSLHNGYSLLINGVSGTVVKNCNFKVGSNSNYQINAPAGSSNLTVRYCKFDGNSTNDSSSFQDAVNYAGTGTFIFEYNYVLNQIQHGVDFSGTGPGSNVTPTIRYNLFRKIGVGSGAHADPWYYFNVNMVSGLYSFNTIYQEQGVITPANPGMFVGTDNFTTGITTSNTSLLNNTVIATGPTQSMTYVFWVANSTGNFLTNSTVNDNYFDSTQCDGVFRPASDYGTSPKASGNIDMTTGSVATPPF